MKAGAWWPLAVAGVLGVTVVANAFLFYEASDRRAAVVEPDYYRKALQWDSTLAERRQDAALGWVLDADLWERGPGRGELRVRLADREGEPLAGAAIRVSAIHNADAARPVEAVLEPGAAAGEYAAQLPLPYRGLWELRFQVRRGAERFSAELRRDSRPAPVAP